MLNMMKNMYLPTETTAFAPSGRGYTRTSARGVASNCMLVGPSGRQSLLAQKGQKHPTSGIARCIYKYKYKVND